MDELIRKLSDKFGLTQEQSYEAFKIVLNFLKDKMPDPAGSQINEILMVGESNDNPANAIKDLGRKFTTK